MKVSKDHAAILYAMRIFGNGVATVVPVTTLLLTPVIM